MRWTIISQEIVQGGHTLKCIASAHLVQTHSTIAIQILGGALTVVITTQH